MIEEVKIQQEEDAWESLEQLTLDEFDETSIVTFEGWPNFKLTLQGADFNGTVPTRVMPPILDLQREIYRTYARAVYNTEDTRYLKKEERERLEIVVSVKQGSSEYIAELAKVLNEIIKHSNMTGQETLLLLLGSGVILGSAYGWRLWVAAKERMHDKQTTVQLSQEETKRTELLTVAFNRSETLQQTNKGIQNFRGALATSLKPEDEITVGGQSIITGERAAEIVPKPQKEVEEARLDGEYLVQEVKFPKRFGNPYRFKVAHIAEELKFWVDASPEMLTDDQISILKDGGFGVETIAMKINAKIKNGRVIQASAFEINWPADEISNLGGEQGEGPSKTSEA